MNSCDKANLKTIRKQQKRKQFKKYGNLFPFYIPAMIFAIIFMYIPMLGLVMAFNENINAYSMEWKTTAWKGLGANKIIDLSSDI